MQRTLDADELLEAITRMQTEDNNCDVCRMVWRRATQADRIKQLIENMAREEDNEDDDRR